MFRNYLKIAFRQLWRNRLMSTVSVVGLAVGLMITLLIVLYVAHEHSYDRFHPQGDRIVKVELAHTDGESSYTVPWMSYRFGEALKNACPEVADFARIRSEPMESQLVQSDAEHQFLESRFRFADAGVLRLFNFPLVRGDVRTVLSQPATVLLTESTARKYFGDADPLGKFIRYNKIHVFQVVGVLRDLPTNSSIKFDFLAHIDASRAIDQANYSSFLSAKDTQTQMNVIGASGTYHTYLLLHPDANRANVAAKIRTILTPREQLNDKKDSYQLHPLFNLHFTVDSPGSLQRARLFSAIGLIVLLLALINYVNISTARATSRAKEVGVRKVAGAARKALVSQFYLESAVQVLLAFGVAMLLFVGLWPLFTTLIDVPIYAPFLQSPYFIAPAVLFLMGCILLSGGYPALLLSGFSPVSSLNNQLGTTSNPSLLRAGLTVVQFAVSVALIIGSVVISQQLDLFLNKDVGIDRARVLTIPVKDENLANHYTTIRDKISRLPGIEAVTASSLVMYDSYMNGWELKRLNKSSTVRVSTFSIDAQFISTMRLAWAIAPVTNQPSLQNHIVINEAAARELGITPTNYRQTLDLGNGDYKVLAGVVKNFNYQSLERGIKPMAFFVGSDTIARDYLYVRLAQNAPIEPTLADIQQVYNQFKPERPFTYAFLDETYRKLYQTQLSNGHLIYVFTGLAIFIACLGLFGLAAFTAAQRTKEIGVRKVLGASVVSIVTLLSKDLLKLVLIAVFIAIPIAWYAMHRWLQEFAYKTTIEWWYFALAGLLAVGIALLTVSFQSIKAALTNPVKSLRTE